MPDRSEKKSLARLTANRYEAPIYCIIHRFNVIPGYERQFTEPWSGVTGAFLESAGALGPRLHEGEDGVHIARAQWLSREDRDAVTLRLPVREAASV